MTLIVPPLLAADYPTHGQPQTVGWTLLDSGADGCAYRHFSGLTLIWSVAYERDGKPWRHVSVAHPDRLPRWSELRAVKEWVCGPAATVYQVLPPESEYVNDNEHCLHLWEPLGHRPLPDFRKLGTL